MVAKCSGRFEEEKKEEKKDFYVNLSKTCSVE